MIFVLLINIQGNYGGVTSGLPGEATCPFDLFIENCNFTRCDAYTVGGKGGALAIFDTTTEIFGTMIVDSQGTAIVFESTSATSPHQLKVSWLLTGTAPLVSHYPS